MPKNSLGSNRNVLEYEPTPRTGLGSNWNVFRSALGSNRNILEYEPRLPTGVRAPYPHGRGQCPLPWVLVRCLLHSRLRALVQPKVSVRVDRATDLGVCGRQSATELNSGCSRMLAEATLVSTVLTDLLNLCI